MPSSKGSSVLWWCDRFDVKPIVISDLDRGVIPTLTDDEDQIASQLRDIETEGQGGETGDFLPSSQMTSSELRAAIRLMRRGILFATFHVTPTIGERYFRVRRDKR